MDRQNFCLFPLWFKGTGMAWETQVFLPKLLILVNSISYSVAGQSKEENEQEKEPEKTPSLIN